MKQILCGIIFLFSIQLIYGQKSDKLPRYFAEPIGIDSTTTVMIPIRYNSDLLSSSKIALWNNFYANIIFYNFRNDSIHRLFKEDTFIQGFRSNSSYYYYNMNQAEKNISSDWIFYFVKTNDYNQSGRIDNDDPSIIYVSDKFGKNLKQITPGNENAVSIQIYNEQGFALIKMQRDKNEDSDFDSKDKDYYFTSLNLKNLEFGNKIEIK